eukprot:TRINITY_DN53120_c1_g1_i1.p1 TRINITY_DN53120_c1_g1~~TRINITY_DN53120_c1_g1_i1.p1  ORF type:complete len:165 (-),score=20.72 TRINITY_DN53120_c1_g1_i1:65-559(-)
MLTASVADAVRAGQAPARQLRGQSGTLQCFAQSIIFLRMDHFSILVRTAPADCWHCGAETEIVSSIRIVRGPDHAECSVSDLTDHPGPSRDIAEIVKDRVSVGEIKLRFSKTAGYDYLSNGCAHCDALFGDFFEVRTRNFEQPLAEFIPADTEGWADVFDGLEP